MRRSGSSSRNAADENTPSVIATVTVFPVRSSVSVMVSAIGELLKLGIRGFLPVGKNRTQSPLAHNGRKPTCRYLQGRVVVFTSLEALALVFKGAQRRCNFTPCVGRLNDPVDEPTFGCDVGVE